MVSHYVRSVRTDSDKGTTVNRVLSVSVAALKQFVSANCVQTYYALHVLFTGKLSVTQPGTRSLRYIVEEDVCERNQRL